MDILKILKDNFNINNIKEQVSSTKKTAQTIESLLNLLQDNKISSSVKDMLNNLKVVMVDKPNIVSINHYVNHFLLKLNPENQPIILKEILEVFHERWKNVDRKTAQVAYNLYNFKNKRIAIYGSCDAMLALVDICNVHQSNIKVIQILGKNDKDGKDQALKIRDKIPDVSATDIFNVVRYTDKIDFLMLTSDIIMHETFIAKSGTLLLTSWAKRNHIPVIVLSDSRKILNKKILPASVLGTFINETPKSTSEIWKGVPDSIEISNYHFEEVENKEVDFFVLEQQAYPPSELSLEVDKILVSKFI